MRIGSYSVPFLSLFLFFALGIVFTEYYPNTINVWGVGGVFVVLIIIGVFVRNKFHQNKTLFKSTLSASLFALGCFVHSYHDNSKHALFYDISKKADFSLITLKKQVGSSLDYHKYYGDLIFVKEKEDYQNCYGGVIVYLPKADSTEYLYGDKILFEGAPSELPAKRNPHEFDYKKYLNRNDIDFQIKGNKSTYLRVAEGTGVLHFIGSYRKKLARRLERYMGTEEAGVAKALVLGYKDDLSPDTLDAFKNTGSMHVLAVSGLHLGILFVLISFLFKLKQLNKVPKFIQFTIIVGALWFYVFLSGMSISVLRAAIMFSVIQLGLLLNRKGNVLNSLFLSAFVVLLLFPKEIFQVGFQLSYLAVLGIVLLHKYIDNWIEFPNRALNYLWSIVAVSISAQVSIGLLSIYYFHSFPLLFPVSNIVVMVLSGFELGLGFSFAIFSHFEALAMPIAFCLDFLISIKLKALSELGALPYVLLNSIYITAIELILYYMVVIGFVYFFLTNKVRSMYLGLISIILIGVFWIWNTYKVSQQNKIVLFGTNDICLAYLKEDKAYIYASEKVNKKAFLFYAEPYLKYNGVKVVKVLQIGVPFACVDASLNKAGIIRMRDQFYLPYTEGLKLEKERLTLLVPKYKVRHFLGRKDKNSVKALLLTNNRYDGFESSEDFMTIKDFNDN